MNDDLKTFCPKCGAEMKVNARYCMHCGYLNYDHPDNKQLKKFANENELQQKYVIGSGNFIQNTGSLNISVTTENKKVFFLSNIFAFLGLVLGGLLFVIFKYGTKLSVIVSSKYPLFLIIVAFVALYIVSLEIIFMKANKPWWKALIPIYNLIILVEISFNLKWLAILFLIPFVNIAFLFIVFYKLGKNFGYNGFLAALLFFIYIPIIAFTGNSFKGINYVNDNEKNNLEKEYKMYHALSIVIIFSFIVGLVTAIYGNFTFISEEVNDVKKYNYIKLSNKIVDKVKEAINTGNFGCNSEDNGIIEGRVYNFYSKNINDDFDLFSLGENKGEINVAVMKNNGNYLYYVSFSDGKIGFYNVLDSELTIDSFLENISVKIDESNKCSIYIE